MKVYDSCDEVEKHWPQILAILIGSIAGFTDGIIYSWTSPYVVKITQDKENYDITEEEASHFNTIQSISMLLTAPIFAVLIDKFGRKKTYLLTAVTQILCWILSAFAKNITLFYIARFCAGISNAIFFCVFPAYVGEIANPNVRGTWGNLISTCVYAGEFLINIIGSYLDVKPTSYICVTLPVLFFILFAMMPESPYWYIMKGRKEEAKNALKFLKRKKNVDKDYEQLKHDVKRQLSETGTWSDLVKINSNRRALLIGGFLRITQQTSGLQMLLVYTQYIFQKAGGNISHELSSIIYTGLGIVLNLFVLVFIINKFSRRALYITSLLSSGLVLYILSAYFYLDEKLNMDLTSINWLPITSMIVYQISISFGISVIPSLMMSELFSASIKAKALLLLIVCFAMGNLIMNLIFYYFNSLFGFYAPFLFFAICNTISIVISIYIIPETNGKTLEEIQQMLKK